MTLKSTPSLRGSIRTASFTEKAATLSPTPEDRHLVSVDGMRSIYVPLCYTHFPHGRICPGKDLAENHLWITIASMFYAFKITPAVNDKGEKIPIDLEFSEHSIR